MKRVCTLSGFLWLAVPLILITAALFIFNKPFPLTKPTYAEMATVAYWSAVLEKKTPEEARNFLFEQAGGFDFQKRHLIDHRFGNAVFDAVGLDGFVVCEHGDPAHFSYGCYHDFMEQSIIAHGIAVVSQLNDRCVEYFGTRWLLCQHGLGHGMLNYFGYTYDDLLSALTLCQETKDPEKDTFGGCYGGIFMEYNKRSMLGDDIEPRPFAGNMLDPCDSIEEAFKKPCFFRLPAWWMTTVFKEFADEKLYTELGEACRDLESYRAGATHICMAGIGIEILARDEDVLKARERCDIASNSAEEQYYCRVFLSYRFSEFGNAESALAACRDMEEAAKCRSHARMLTNTLIEKNL